jgi:hypothetical protein
MEAIDFYGRDESHASNPLFSDVLLLAPRVEKLGLRHVESNVIIVDFAAA